VSLAEFVEIWFPKEILPIAAVYHYSALRLFLDIHILIADAYFPTCLSLNV